MNNDKLSNKIDGNINKTRTMIENRVGAKVKRNIRKKKILNSDVTDKLKWQA